MIIMEYVLEQEIHYKDTPYPQRDFSHFQKLRPNTTSMLESNEGISFQLNDFYSKNPEATQAFYYFLRTKQ